VSDVRKNLEFGAAQSTVGDACSHLLATPVKFEHECAEPSIPVWLKTLAEQFGARSALGAPFRESFTYARLFEQIARIVDALNDFGIGRGDRIAIVLPNADMMAAAFLGVAAGATGAPLNPGYRELEFKALFNDLQPRALIVEAGADTAAVAAARRASIPLLEFSVVRKDGAADVELQGKALARTCLRGFAKSDDVALILFTSGTTSRPKLVPLTHANLTASARNIADTFELGPEDRCLNVMPLFHIHGLVGGLLAPLVSGGSVVCPPSFNASEFFHWLEHSRPTWYTAVPTMHQLILSRAPANIDIIEKRRLRFIRSSSAALPIRVLKELESIFAAPVIESYGMTEAALQITSNPLPPGRRKLGSVGRAAGPEVAVMDESGNFLPSSMVGEVVIRGANIMGGYCNSAEANASAFSGGWFRTGDQGYLDSDGYLFLTGRIKELINRAGEKISPRQIDDALLAHPAVEQAVAFALPHRALGEEVAAAVVLRRDARATAEELREFAATRLADFKVPRQIVIVEEIPKGPTGKLQRNGLGEKFGVTAVDQLLAEPTAKYEAPRTKLEEAIADIWRRVLRLEQVGRHENFFHLGGHSLLALAVVNEMQSKFGKHVSVALLLNSPTIAQLASVLPQQPETAPSPLLVIQPQGSKPPFFCVHGTDSYVRLARYLGEGQPFYGLAQHLEGRKVSHTRIEDIAAYYLSEIRTIQPNGPYYIGGHSFGGVIAFEMAHQLQREHDEVALLVLIDSAAPGTGLSRTDSARGETVAKQNSQNLSSPSLKKRLYFARQTVKDALRKKVNTAACEVYHVFGIQLPTALQTFYADEVVYGKIYPHAHECYAPQSYSGRTVYLKSEDARDRALGWPELITGGLQIYEVPGNHLSMLVEPHVRQLAETLKECLGNAQAGVDEQSATRLRARDQILLSDMPRRSRMAYG
jgi:oxalate---CoA ligase